MIVYVESNFVLEIALEQEEVDSARAILELAESKRIDFVIPAFALSEPFSSVMHRGNERARLCNTLTGQLKELGRSQPHKPLAASFLTVPTASLAIEREEVNRLVSTVSRILVAARQVRMDASNFRMAQEYETRHGLSLQDAVVYSCVMSDLQGSAPSEMKCFLSRNSRDFGDPSILAELENLNCKYLPKFADGLNYVRRHC